MDRRSHGGSVPVTPSFMEVKRGHRSSVVMAAACETLDVALCLVGQLRTASQQSHSRHWAQAATYLRSLLAGRSWTGLHAFAVVDGSQEEFELTRSALTNASLWGLPEANVHALRQTIPPMTFVQAACGAASQRDAIADFCTRLIHSSGTNKSQLARGGVCRQAMPISLMRFYTQWGRAKACCEQVEQLEARCGRRFEWLIKMRPDWNFVADRRQTNIAALEAFESLAGSGPTVHARLRCGPDELLPRRPTEAELRQHGPKQFLMANEAFLAQNVHNKYALNIGCYHNVTIIDESLVITRRPESPVCAASSLPCPLANNEVAASVFSACRPRSIVFAECLWHVAALHAGTRRFNPIAASWGTTDDLWRPMNASAVWSKFNGTYYVR